MNQGRGPCGDSRPLLSAERSSARGGSSLPFFPASSIVLGRSYPERGVSCAGSVPAHGSAVTRSARNFLCYNFLQRWLREKSYSDCIEETFFARRQVVK